MHYFARKCNTFHIPVHDIGLHTTKYWLHVKRQWFQNYNVICNIRDNVIYKLRITFCLFAYSKRSLYCLFCTNLTIGSLISTSLFMTIVYYACLFCFISLFHYTRVRLKRLILIYVGILISRFQVVFSQQLFWINNFRVTQILNLKVQRF